MNRYSYGACLEKSYQVNWTIAQVMGDHSFDTAKRWLPPRLSGADGALFLSDEEKIKLTQVEMGAYAHLFGFVEEFIAPKITSLALDFQIDHREAYDALANFAAEEVKHMHLFRKVRASVNTALGFELDLLDNEKAVAHAVLGKNTGAVLLLTAAIEWFTQLHYVDAFKDNGDLDAFTKHIFKSHWLEESQHAKMDHLETVRAFEGMSDAEKDVAIDDLIDLVGAVDGLLQEQSKMDVGNFVQYTRRELSGPERDELNASILAAKRYTFIESGVTHPNFQELFGFVTIKAQQEKVGAALETVLG